MKSKLVGFIGRWLAGGILREISEGKRGPVLYRWYWKAKGKKTATGAILALLLAATYALDPKLGSSLTPIAGSVAAVLIGAGLIDRDYHKAPPPMFVGEVLHLLLSLGPAASAVTALLVSHLSPEWAQRVDLGCGAVAVATAWLAARLAPAPFETPLYKE